MTFDYKKPFTTADGRKARLLADDLNNSHQLVVAVESCGKGEYVHLYRKDGITAFLGVEDTLVNIPERKERWRSVFSDYVSSEFETRDAANEFVGWGDNLGLLRIVYEDDRIIKQEYFPLHGEEK